MILIWRALSAHWHHIGRTCSEFQTVGCNDAAYPVDLSHGGRNILDGVLNGLQFDGLADCAV